MGEDPEGGDTAFGTSSYPTSGSFNSFDVSGCMARPVQMVSTSWLPDASATRPDEIVKPV